MARATFSRCSYLIARHQQTQTSMDWILTHFQITQLSENCSPIRMLLSRRTSLRQHEETQASIQQKVEKAQHYQPGFQTHSKPKATALPPHTSRLRRRAFTRGSRRPHTTSDLRRHDRNSQHSRHLLRNLRLQMLHCTYRRTRHTPFLGRTSSKILQHKLQNDRFTARGADSSAQRSGPGRAHEADARHSRTDMRALVGSGAQDGGGCSEDGQGVARR